VGQALAVIHAVCGPSSPTKGGALLMRSSRRSFVRHAAAATIALSAGLAPRARAYPLGLDPGLQLWSVKDALEADQAGTLRKIGAMGYREVELYQLPASVATFKQQCADSGLAIVGGHFYLQSLKDNRTIDAALQLGMSYVIVVFPTLQSIRDKDISDMSVRDLNPLYEKITADDYKWNADQFNHYGAQVKQSGLQLGYHTHAVDLKRFGQRSAFEILIESTDPGLVVFEMDCGHVIHAGADPMAYLRKYPTRIQLLHLKDLKAGYGISASIDTEEKDTNAELGAGVIDWKTLFQVAAKGSIKHYFIEHEGEMAHPPLASAANSLAYLKHL
jgi:sugar phosphate isomerase/epimerase